MTSRYNHDQSAVEDESDVDSDSENERDKLDLSPGREEYSMYNTDEWPDDPHHLAFIQTGCNISTVLSTIWSLGQGINYFQSARLVKCGVKAKTQVRRQFEQMEALGFYSDIEHFIGPNGDLSESLPTADSATSNPDGDLRAAREAGYFAPGGKFYNHDYSYYASLNVDTGLVEPQHQRAPEVTDSGQRIFKTYFKNSPQTCRNKCMVTFKSVRSAIKSKIGASRRNLISVAVPSSSRCRFLMAGEEEQDSGAGAGAAAKGGHNPARNSPEYFLLFWRHFKWIGYIIDASLDELCKVAMQACKTPEEKFNVRKWLEKWSKFTFGEEQFGHWDFKDSEHYEDIDWDTIDRIISKGLYVNFTELLVYFKSSDVVPKLINKLDQIASKLTDFNQFDDYKLHMYYIFPVFQDKLSRLSDRFNHLLDTDVSVPAYEPEKEQQTYSLISTKAVYTLYLPNNVERSLAVLPAPRKALKDSFAQCFKQSFDYFKLSGRNLSDFYFTRQLKEIDRRNLWGEMRKAVEAAINRDDDRKVEIFNEYFRLDQRDNVKNEFGKFDRLIRDFTEENQAPISHNFLHLISDIFNIQINLIEHMSADDVESSEFALAPLKENSKGYLKEDYQIFPSRGQTLFETEDEFEIRSQKYLMEMFIQYEDGKYSVLVNPNFKNNYRRDDQGTEMQKNLVDMLIKSQESSIRAHLNIDPSSYSAEIIDGAIPLKFSVDDFNWIDVERHGMRKGESEEETIEYQWVLFQTSFISGALPTGDILEDDKVKFKRYIFDVREKYIDSFGFDHFEEFNGKAGDFEIYGIFDNSKTLRTYLDIIKFHRVDREAIINDNPPRRIENPRLYSVLDFVQLVKKNNLTAVMNAKNAIDMTFEVMHLNNDSKEGNGDFFLYMKCLWFSLISYVMQPKLEAFNGSGYLNENQRKFIYRTYGRFSDYTMMISYLLSVCKMERFKDNQYAMDLIKIIKGDTTLMFASNHKKIIASILNLTIFEMRMNRDLRITPDRSAFEVEYMEKILGTDTFYLNPEPSLANDQVMLINRDFITSINNVRDKRVNSEDFEFIQDYWYTLGPPSSFFSCASKCFKEFLPESKNETKMLFENENDFKTHFIDVLARLFAMYNRVQGIIHHESIEASIRKKPKKKSKKVEEDSDDDEGKQEDSKSEKGEGDAGIQEDDSKATEADKHRDGDGGKEGGHVEKTEEIQEESAENLPEGKTSREDKHESDKRFSFERELFKVSAAYEKIKLAINKIIEYHFSDLLAGNHLDSSVASNFGQLDSISINVWKSFLAYCATDQYSPSPFEIQIFCDYYIVNVCVYDLNSGDVMSLYRSQAMKNLELNWVFKPFRTCECVWMLAYDGTPNGFCQMRQIKIEGEDLDSRLSNSFIVKPNLRNITHLQKFVNKESDLISSALVIVNMQEDFYNAFTEYLMDRNNIPFNDIFNFSRTINRRNWDRLIDKFFMFTENRVDRIVKRFKKINNDVLNGMLKSVMKDFKTLCAFTASNHKSNLPLMKDIKKSFDHSTECLKRALMDKIEKYVRKKVIGRNREKLGDIEDFKEEIGSAFIMFENQKEMMNLFTLMEVNLVEKRPFLLPKLSMPKEFWAGDVMKECLNGLPEGKKISILMYHYGRLPSNEEEKKKKIIDLWDDYYNKDNFLSKAPSPMEVKMLAKKLKVRIILYTNHTYGFYDLGILSKSDDFGPNDNMAIPLTIINGNFRFLEYTVEIPRRSAFEKNICDESYWRALKKDFMRNPLTEQLKNGELDGTVKPKHDGMIYKALGMEPNAPIEKFLKNRRRFKMALIMFHTDQQKFTNRLGEYGPQDQEELDEIVNEVSTVMSPIEFVIYSAQIICDPISRAIYHFTGHYMPNKYLNEKFRPEFISDLGVPFKEYNLSHIGDTQWFELTKSMVPPFDVYILNKRNNPRNVHGLRKVKDDSDQFANVLKCSIRDRIIDEFSERFVCSVSSFNLTGQYCKENYAAMIPIRKTDSRLGLSANDFKVFDMYDYNGNLDLNYVKVMRIIRPSLLPDMFTGKPKAEDAIRDNEWANEWAGLRMCVQAGFYFIRKKSTQIIIDGLNLMPQNYWLKNFFAAPDRSWKLIFEENKVLYVRFVGLIHPSNITYDTIRQYMYLVHLMYDDRYKSSGSPEDGYFMKNTFYPVFNRFTGEDKQHDWHTEHLFNSYFSNMTDYDERREQSMGLMRVIGALFNIRFVVVELFPEHDINSLIKADVFYYYFKESRSQDGKTVKEYVTTMKNTFLKGVFWNLRTIPRSEYVKQSQQGQPASELPVYVIWKDGRWQYLTWITFVDFIEEQRNRARKLHELKKAIVVKKEKVLPAGYRGLIPGMKKDSAATDKPIPRNKDSDWMSGHHSSGSCSKDEKKMERNEERGYYDNDKYDRYDYDEYDEDNWIDDYDEDDNFFDVDEEDEDNYDRSEEDDDQKWAESLEDEMEREGADMRGEYYEMNDEEFARSLDKGADEAIKFYELYDKHVNKEVSGKLKRHDDIGLKGKGKGVHSCVISKVVPVLKKLGPEFTQQPRFQQRPQTNLVVINEDKKELHFLCQRLGEMVNVLEFLEPYGSCVVKFQIGQTEQTKMLALILACCFEECMFVPVKGCFTSRIAMGAKGLRKGIVNGYNIPQRLKRCFDMKISSFKSLLNFCRENRLVSIKRMNFLENQIQRASDELWVDDFRCSLILCRTYIQAALEGKVRPEPEYLSPELAKMLNDRVFSKVSVADRNRNIQTIRDLMNSPIASQLLPLFRVVFHPDLHMWRTVLPRKKKKCVGDDEYWQWDVDILSESGSPLGKRFRALQKGVDVGLRRCLTYPLQM